MTVIPVVINSILFICIYSLICYVVIAGIEVKMLTGDFKTTARAIALGCNILKENDDINDMIMDGSEFQARVGGLYCLNCNLNQECRCPLNEAQKKKCEQATGQKDLKIRQMGVKDLGAFKEIY